MLRLAFTSILSIALLFLAACKEKTQSTEKKSSPIAQPAPLPQEIKKALPQMNETLFMEHAASSSISWKPFDQTLFETAQTSNRLICLFISDFHPTRSFEIIKTLESRPDLIQKINNIAILSITDSQLHPELHQYIQELAKKSEITFPAFIWLSPTGSPVSWNVTSAEQTTKLPALSNAVETVASIWKDDPQYVRDDSARARKDREETLILRQTGHAPVLQEKKSLHQAMSNLSALYDPSNERLDIRSSNIPSEQYEFLYIGSFLADAPTYITERSRDRSVSMINALLNSPVHDDLDGLFFSKMSRLGVLRPVLLKNSLTNLQIASLLLNSSQSQADQNLDWLTTAERTLTAVEKHFIAANGMVMPYNKASADFDSLVNYYTWTYEELKDALSPEELNTATTFYGIKENIGNILRYGGLSKNYTDRNYLTSGLSKTHPKIVEKLNDFRSKKAPQAEAEIFAPLLENSYYASVLLDAYRASKNEAWEKKALAHLNQILSELMPTADRPTISSGWSAGKPASTPARAKAITYLLKACIDAYTTTAETKWFSSAEKIATYLQTNHIIEDHPLPIETFAKEKSLISPTVSTVPNHGTATIPLLRLQLKRLARLGSAADLQRLTEKLENDKPLEARYDIASPLFQSHLVHGLKEYAPLTLVVSKADSRSHFLNEIQHSSPLTEVVLISPEKASALLKNPVTAGSIIRMTENDKVISSSPTINSQEGSSE